MMAPEYLLQITEAFISDHQYFFQDKGSPGDKGLPRDTNQQRPRQGEGEAAPFPQRLAAAVEQLQGIADLDWGAPSTYQDDGWGDLPAAAAGSEPLEQVSMRSPGTGSVGSGSAQSLKMR